jgi:hypothetical protein
MNMEELPLTDSGVSFTEFPIQQLAKEIASLYEGSRHGNSRFMKRYKQCTPDEQAAIDNLLPKVSLESKSAPPAVTWESKVPFDELISIHLNAAGVPNTWFVRQFKLLSATNQERVNAKLVEIGHQPYFIKGSGQRQQRGGQIQHRTPASVTDEPKLLNAEQIVQRDQLQEAIREVVADKERANRFLNQIMNTEYELRTQLTELTGVEFKSSYLDPFNDAYKPAHEHARLHREEVLGSEQCGCFFCGATFKPGAISEWVENGQTALCPNCGIDAVIGDKSNYQPSKGFLLSMFKYWFSVPIRIRSMDPVERPEAPEVKGSEVKPIEPIVVNKPEQRWDWRTDMTQEAAEKEREIILPMHLADESDMSGIGANLINSIIDEVADEEDSEDYD